DHAEVGDGSTRQQVQHIEKTGLVAAKKLVERVPVDARDGDMRGKLVNYQNHRGIEHFAPEVRQTKCVPQRLDHNLLILFALFDRSQQRRQQPGARALAPVAPATVRRSVTRMPAARATGRVGLYAAS